LAELLNPDICVIGAGSGGLSVAAGVAAFGASVVLIENGRMGGDCLNYGCVPSKALIAAAKRAHDMRTAGSFGIDAEPKIDFRRVHQHIRGVIAAIAPNDSAERFTGLGVRVIAGTGRFVGKLTVAVDGDFEIKARRFVIASGSSPAVPPIPGLVETPHLTNETIFDLTELPSHLVVIGGGPIGLELAQAFRRLGAAVTVVEALRPLPKDDPECSGLVVDTLAREGVAIRTGATVRSVRRAADKIEVVITASGEEDTIAASHLLVATGRVPNLATLDLKAARIEHGPNGIVVDRRLRTSNRNVYAIGDVAGGPMFTHVANYHAGLVIRDALFGLPARVKYDEVPRVTYTDPELAHVGMTDEEASKKGYKIRVLRWPYHENDRAQAERATRGHVKVVTGKTGRILGVTMVGAQAGELIAPWTLAISRGLNIAAMAQIVAPYPTLGEVGKRSAMLFFAGAAANPIVRRVIRWVRRLG
jgi:pyruvate/2-oxoglutarate dehydrogenase complex dihydrolipoamide dehydrogenase (E3) component